MEDIAQKLKAARQKKGLSIADISEKTKIRPHVIEAFEQNNFSVMPAVYVKSFLKTLYKELNISDSPTDFEASETSAISHIDTDSSFKIKPLSNEPKVAKENQPIKESKKESKSEPTIFTQSSKPDEIIPEKPEIKEHPLKQEYRKKNIEPKTKKSNEKSKVTKKAPNIATFDEDDDSNSVYTEIFKKNNIEKRFNPRGKSIVILSAVIVIIAVAAYLVFFTDLFNGKENKENITALTEDSAVVISSENKDLFSTFIPQAADSIILRAKSVDTAWLSLDLDGKFSEQALMKPGMERRWSAKEYIIITQGNAGAIEYYRNNELLQPFGTKGTVVRNIKITMSEVLNTSQSIQDSLRKASNSISTKPKKKKREIRRIEPSKIEN